MATMGSTSKTLAGGIVLAVILLFMFMFDARTAPAPQMTAMIRRSSKTCLLPDGPQPYILMTRGRSGSGSTFQVIGELSGKQTPSLEYPAKDTRQITKFLDDLPPGDAGEWLLRPLCDAQRKFPDAGLVAFKWKACEDHISHAAVLAGWKHAAGATPQVKVVRSKRNPLDVILSGTKHAQFKVPAHCKTEECRAKHAVQVELPTRGLLQELQEFVGNETAVDRSLVELNIPHIQVSYEKLYGGEDAPEEWMRIFRFLGVGPKQGLTLEKLHDAMEQLPTSSPNHKDSIKNYDEVVATLQGTKFEAFLHR